MKRIRSISILIIVAVLGIIGVTGVAAQVQRSQQLISDPRTETAAPLTGSIVSTTFTYQGLIKQSGSPINGNCDLVFRLFDASISGTPIGSPITRTLPITNGLFTVGLNFGDGRVFAAEARWLEIRVQCPAGSGGFTTLNPRQALTPVPLALALPGLRTEPNATSPNIIGGHSSNAVTAPSFGSVIVGGGSGTNFNSINGSDSTIVGGSHNTIDNDDAFIGGGFSNTVTAASHEGTIGGGGNNSLGGDHAAIFAGINNTANGDESFIGGGNGNTATAAGASAVIGGGDKNTASNIDATIGGGNLNTASGLVATVGGGNNNHATGDYATVSGGTTNSASGIAATVGGGSDNHAIGYLATVPGGRFNDATMSTTLAAGYRAKANQAGTFVWADSTNADFASTANDQFLIRAAGGVGIGTNAPATQLHVVKSINGAATNPGDNVAVIENTNTNNSADVLALKIGGIVNPATSNNFITFLLGNNTSVGAIQGNGTNSVELAGAGNDYAEFLPRLNPAESLQAGDIVGVNAGHISKQTREAAQVMVISAGPIVVGNDPGEAARANYDRVVFIGQVDAKVRGTVQAGDFIVPSGSNDGTGIAVSPETITAEQFAQVVGQAWVSSADANLKSVRVVIGLTHADPFVKTLLDQNQQQADRITALEAQLVSPDQSVSSTPFNVFNLISVLALIGFVAMWLQQRSKRGGHQ